MFLTFYGEPRGDKHTHDHAHESPMVMLIPLESGTGRGLLGMIWYKSWKTQINKFLAFNRIILKL